ncbi:secreted Ly-6/uPAR domain-containing protein 2 [Suncus etruscus]|uniref:secreted Ly-6/uPAR domain-containing protein 2 n=1 Tax=Suncus etruscus TaxID=109475 RepID=UPI00210F70CF|nr:secreted Ly-6/uPAR domain-containing protein 2 [Suncus etruscus]
MPLLLSLLLASALSLELACAMQCHQCTGFGICHHLASCPWNSDHCVTVASRAAVSLQDEPLVMKMCSQGCPEPAALGLGRRVSVSCCQASACNED